MADIEHKPRRQGFRDAGAIPPELIAYYCDLVEVHVECNQLLSSLEQRSPLDVEIAACEVAATWALASLAGGTADRDDLDPTLRRQALIELEVGRQRIARVFAHALAVTAHWDGAGYRLHDVLRRLCTKIGIDVTADVGSESSRPSSPS